MRSLSSRSFLSFAALAGLVAACHGSSGSTAFLDPGVNDLGFVAASFAVEDGILAAHVFELGIDQNGDGDGDDVLLRVVSLADGSETVIPNVRAQGRPVVDDGFVSFLVPESADGRDLNGDGDTDDVVLHVLDTRDGAITSVGLACALAYQQDGALVAFAVPEAEQGADLDGDGLRLSQLACLYEADLGRTTQLGLPVFPGATLVSGSHVVLRADETVAGDLDGDGDATDAVVFLYDTRTGALHDTERAPVRFNLEGSLFATLVDERENGRDINRNGRTDDIVGELYDLDISHNALRMTVTNRCFLGAVDRDVAVLWQGATNEIGEVKVFDRQTISFLPVTLLDFPNEDPRALHDRRLAFRVFEFEQGADFNGDGDRFDAVVSTFDARNGVITDSDHVADSEPQLGEHHVVFLSPIVPGRFPAPTTLVVQVLDSGVERDVGIRADEFRLEDERVVAAVPEEWADADLNADGDLFDRVIEVYDLRTGRTVNTRIELFHPLEGPDTTLELDGDVLVLLQENLRLTAVRLR